jgi:hypothetical protein
MLPPEPSMKCGRQARMWSILVGCHPVLSYCTGRHKHYTTFRGGEVPGTHDLLWCRRPRVPNGLNLSWGNPPPLRAGGGGLFDVRAITMIIRVHVVELLRQAVMGRVSVLKYLVLGV